MASPLHVARGFAPTEGPAHEVVALAFEQRERSRLRAQTLGGEPIGIDLPPGTVIRHGDRLLLDDGRVVAVHAAPESLLQVQARDAVQLARIAYHVGNRHVPVQLGDGWLRLLPDHVLRAMIERLGGRVTEVEDGFQPEAGAYGHGHVHHHHDDQGHGGRIHAFDPRHEAPVHDHPHGGPAAHDHDVTHEPGHGHGYVRGHGHAHGPRRG
jgi:urease accessory protein